MATDHRAELKKIRTFPSLVRYLRDEMGWPIDAADFEELTFDYTPEELGIDARNAAKIEEIKRLRPLSTRQPWGIFFVKFEPKKLPVVALRRILSQVVLRKRASANRAERAAWAADDLLFVSNYGEGDERRISFAHFSQDEAKGDLPTLKVLGWDNLDTPLHLDDVADKLTRNLAWPANDGDVEGWRKSWRSAFTLRHREVIATSRDLSIRLAELARAIRDRICTALAIETERGPLTKLMKAFQEALVHDLDAAGFADMYAQTIAYGLLSARIANPKVNTADHLPAQIPVTNPFLKELMETFLHVGGRRGKAGGPGIDFDELGVSEVVELLDDANMEAVVRDFGDKNPQEDPVIHFYELFLKEYDAKKRLQRGVFYTPRPVVSYIVRSVHELLQTEFGLADGLADMATWGEMAKAHDGLAIPEGVNPTDRFVTVLDPATGTGTFLVEAIEVIHRTLVEKWKRAGHGEKKILDLWNDYVPKHLLPRLHGYELLMAPYAIAHMKVGLKLYDTGYRFGSDERARIYLTNALEPPQDFSGQLAFIAPALAHEAQAVNAIKRQQRFTVVIGNPPYAGVSANMSDAASRLIEPYKFVDGQPLGERKHWLQDDYAKFIRLGQLVIEHSGIGTVGYITNNGYLDNPTFRGMRQNLMKSFSEIRVLDLHGSIKKRDVTTLSKRDENVFDIEQGVAIGLFVRPTTPPHTANVQHADLLGPRSSKYEWLTGHSLVSQGRIHPSSPYYFFVRREETHRAEYEASMSVTSIFKVWSTGVQTSRDSFAVAPMQHELEKRLREFVDTSVSDDQLKISYGLKDMSFWKVSEVRRQFRRVARLAESRSYIKRIDYRPFDTQAVFFHEMIIHRPKAKVMRHMLGGENLALLLPRQLAGEEFHHAFCTRNLAEMCVISSKTTEQNNLFPLYLYEESGSLELSLVTGERRNNARIPNLGNGFLKALGNLLKLPFGSGDEVPKGLTPEDTFHYAYAVLHSPGYRSRYAEFLKIDFPRLPLTSSLALFRDLARFGGELVALHLVEAAVQQAITARYHKSSKAWRYEVAKGQRLPVTLLFNGPEKPVVGKVGWSDDTVWIDAVKPKKGAADAQVTGTFGFRGVPEKVWNFHIGGYQVCEKWLKDRKDRTLTADDIAHYHRIVIALHETIRLMREIDEVIDAHGGWPGAFQGESTAKQAPERLLKVPEPRAQYNRGKDIGKR